MDLAKVLVWIQVGTEMVKVAQGSINDVRAALAAKGIEADTAQLDKVAAGYAALIAHEEAIAHPGPS